ncbi:hypothetical protein HPB48_004193 [Haemaphysalis longicornis]|uniref:Dihydrolipoyllysine-residue succinyltransferase component of 2-oxoglutarate dehydrogenase complex, mitochondrial n=1 Tax=Haemaphysalis longicornis TaxID=44386 RepID=A0A9J6GC87_HAELO|nr:hypothetical protein HPB48_004193 [Haemaphysalis longicornis]
MRVIKCPQLAESLSEGDIRWNKAVGDSVAEDEVICEVETDKTSVPIHAPAAGVVAELLVEDGATIQPGKDIMRLKVGAGKLSFSVWVGRWRWRSAGCVCSAAIRANTARICTARCSVLGGWRSADRQVSSACRVAQRGRHPLEQRSVFLASLSVFSSACWSVCLAGLELGKVGVEVTERGNGTTSVPIHAPVGGVILEILAADGTTVQPGKDLLRIQVGGGGQVALLQLLPAGRPHPHPLLWQPHPRRLHRRDQYQPRHLPRQQCPQVRGQCCQSSPRTHGVHTSVQHPAARTRCPGCCCRRSGRPRCRCEDRAEGEWEIGWRGRVGVKMNRMRQRIAQRLKDAQNTYAMLTTFNEVDMTSVIQMRNKYKDAFAKKHGVKLGFMSPFVKAAAFALQDQPVVNAVIDEQEIVYRDYIDISVAVSTPKGLVVPVVRNCERMNYADIEKAIFELGEKARTGSLAIEDMDGGTFTISNGGVFGSMFGTPIINPPQSAILGMHAIFERPVAINGKVEIRPMMYICLTYDHRLIDGREAVTFLKKVKAAVEDPAVLMLDV